MESHLGTSCPRVYHSIVKPVNILFALALLAIPGALGQGLPDLGDVSQTELSPIQERRLGESIMRQIRADRSYSDDAEVTDYLNTLGYRLVSASPESRQPFDFFLIVDPQVNAFALPGGFIGVNSGLVLTAQSESELASVLAHEVAHVTQRHITRMIAAQKQAQLTSLVGFALAILAARANSQLAEAALAASQANYIQSSLNFTRDNEREADRAGFQILDRAGFDPQAMAVFFERLQRSTRFYETSAPSYLRTHPLTFERIADMQNRSQNLPYRQVPDSLEFQLIRAKLKAPQDSPQESVAFFEESLKERKYLSEAASRYGLVAALMRAKAYSRAREELQALRKTVRTSPIVETLAAQLYGMAGNNAAALQTYREALRNYPGYRALVYDYADALLREGQPEEALKLVESRLQYAMSDYRLYQLQAKSYAALNNYLLQHRALAEYYYRLGNLPAAIEQLVLAQKSGDGDFYQLSSVDARLRELRSLDEENRREARDKR
ncbi:MAG: M48 family metallopeptidase [Betaproteobacteria bacterium]|nr:M48 family metallopeptidase [Betaproteobacteria bacterium]